MNDQVLTIVKIGGKHIDDDKSLKEFLLEFLKVPSPKILVHGGGKSATTIAERMGVAQEMIMGRRVTDQETLMITTMVYAGWINKKITSALNAQGCRSIGLSGADGYLIPAKKRSKTPVDFGFVGDPLTEEIDAGKIHDLLSIFDCLVIAPVTADQNGQLLNTNADVIASVLSRALMKYYSVRLIYCFEQDGVILNNNPVETISKSEFEKLIRSGEIHSGMIPKLQSAFDAYDSGVEKVVIGNAVNIYELLKFTNGNGTLLT